MSSELAQLPPELEKFWRTDDGLTAEQRAAGCWPASPDLARCRWLA
ncbi:MAG: hypothetical protein LBK71_11880 [Verrucomicrobiales bacterium]|nr:hypothetical protein [Verrucomicrobiales bacterium]